MINLTFNSSRILAISDKLDRGTRASIQLDHSIADPEPEIDRDITPQPRRMSNTDKTSPELLSVEIEDALGGVFTISLLEIDSWEVNPPLKVSLISRFGC
jgi:hypothetical protein